MGTNHPDYEARFEKVVSAPAPAEPAKAVPETEQAAA